MNEKEYNKLVKERDDHNKRINDQFTTEDQRNWSKQRVAEINKLTADYERKNKPESNPKIPLEQAMEGSRNNLLKMSAAYAPNLGSTESASLKENPDFLEADKKRDEAKMKDASNLSNGVTVGEAENDIQNLAEDKFRELTLQAPLNEDDPEALQAQNDIEKAVADTKVDGKKTNPKDVIDNLSKEYGISTNFTPDGKIVPTEESQWKRADIAGKLAMFGTALSCIISAASGGNIPPINFNKIMGVDKQYTTYLANVHQYNEAIQAGVKKEAENKADADLGNYLKDVPEEERKIITDVLSEFEFTKAEADKERLEKQGEVSKELILAQATAAYNALSKLHEYVRDGKITQKDFDNLVKYTKASMGQWSGWFERYMPSNVGVNVGPVGVNASRSQ